MVFLSLTIQFIKVELAIYNFQILGYILYLFLEQFSICLGCFPFKITWGDIQQLQLYKCLTHYIAKNNYVGVSHMPETVGCMSLKQCM